MIGIAVCQDLPETDEMTHARHAHGPLVRALREAKGLTLAQLSATTGLSASYLSRIERGERTATWGNTLAIAAAMSVHAACLTGQRPAIRVLRRAVAPDLTAEEFAESVGIDTLELARIELGGTIPDADTLGRIAQRLGVSTTVLQPRLPPASTDQEITK